MILSFLYVYLIGAIILNNYIGGIVIRLGEKSKFLVMGGLHKIRIFNNLQRRTVALRKQNRYSIIVVCWQLFWIVYLLMLPILLKIFSFILPDEIINQYIHSLQMIEEIFFLELITIVFDIAIEGILYLFWRK